MNPVPFFFRYSYYTLALLYFIVVQFVIVHNFNSFTYKHTKTHCVWLAIIFAVYFFPFFLPHSFRLFYFAWIFLSVERKLVYHLMQRSNMFSFCRCLLVMALFLFIYLFFARFDTISLLLTSSIARIKYLSRCLCLCVCVWWVCL